MQSLRILSNNLIFHNVRIYLLSLASVFLAASAFNDSKATLFDDQFICSTWGIVWTLSSKLSIFLIGKLGVREGV